MSARDPDPAPAARTARLNRAYPWVVLGISFTTVAAAFGCRAAFALFFVAVIEEFQWSRGLAAGALTLGSVAWTVSAPVWGQMLDRLGPRFVFPAGAGLMAAGFIVSAMTQAVWHYYLGMGLLVGFGFAALPMTSQATVISNWFVRKRGMAMGLAASGIGAGIFLVVPAAEWLIGAFGWRNAYLMLAGLMVAAVVPLNVLFQRRRPQDMGLLPDFGVTTAAASGGPRRAREGGVTLAAALRNYRFWALAGGFVLGAIPVHMVLVHQVAAMVDAGLSREFGAWVLGLTGLFTTFTMIGMGTLSDRIGSERAYTIGSLALVGGILFILNLEGMSEIFVASLYPPLFAVGFGSYRHGRGYRPLAGGLPPRPLRQLCQLVLDRYRAVCAIVGVHLDRRPEQRAGCLVWCLVNTRHNLRRIFSCRQGAMTSSGVYHARKSNAADGEKDPQIMTRINQTPHQELAPPEFTAAEPLSSAPSAGRFRQI